MTVEENLRMGAFVEWTAADVAARREYVYGLFPRLAERRRQKAATMSGGEQAMLAMGRALMGRPKLLLLDEPSSGWHPSWSSSSSGSSGRSTRAGRPSS